MVNSCGGSDATWGLAMMNGISAGARVALLGTTSLSLLLSPVAGYAQALPTGGSVTYGEATISHSGSSLLVTQSSHNAILDWNSFSIGGGAATHFDNGTGATLNRVTGALPSSIDGTLTATGSLYLVNPAGIAVGTGGLVRTGGSFVASAHDVSDADFLSGGDMVFSGLSKAGVINEGVIASLGGDVVLTARRVENSGTILAGEGDVGLLAGYEVLLRDLGTDEGRFAVRVGGADTEVVNKGTITAANAELRANGGNVYALAGNTEGVVTATGVQKQGGRIFLTAGEGGSVTATQRIVAQPTQQAASLPQSVPLPQERPATLGGTVRIAADRVTLGGAIDVSGDAIPGGTIIAVAREQLTLTADARLDASGSDGGLILLGGDFQGGADAQNTYWHEAIGTTQTTLVAQGAVIRADGTTGAGGNVVVWGDGHTGFAGHISATGITRGGDAEVSGKSTLAYTGFADLRASQGAFGTLLLDPYNITISNDIDSNHDGGFTATGPDSVINATTLLTQLAAANVTVSTFTGSGQNGDITVSAALSWNSGGILFLNAAGNIAIDAPITAGSGTLALQSSGTITTGAAGAVDVNSFVLLNGAWRQIGATLPAFTATGFRIQGGSFLRATGGDGTGGNPYVLTDIYGMQGMATHLSGHFALGNDINAAGTAQWWGGGGFVPIGRGNISTSFSGSFDGRGHIVSGLTINRSGENDVGLFGRTNGAAISNVGLVGGAVSGRDRVGGLVGYQTDGSITQSYATGAVSGETILGGLVGLQSGGSITRSYATGAVQGHGNLGGLVGHQTDGSITQSYATGAVWGLFNIAGGLVGAQGSGSITESYATGSVLGLDVLGGLVGRSSISASVTNSYWDRQTTGQSKGIGDGLDTATGLTTAQMRQAWSYAGWDLTNVWYQDRDLRPMLRAFAAGDPDADGVYEITNLYQLQLMGAYLGRNYALAAHIDASPTNAALAGFDPAGIWGAQGFAPIGQTDTANSFSGTFDGRGNTISGLTINRPGDDDVGLFGRIEGATITNVGLVGGAISGVSYVGALVGHQVSGIIAQSYTTGAVSGLNHVGGLVGHLESGSIAKSYSTGAVSGDMYIGGLVGRQNGGSITQSYATGAVLGTTDVGGLAGHIDSGASLTNSFWDISTTGQSQGRGSGSGTLDATGLTTAQMRNPFTFINAGWDFAALWGKSSLNENSGYMMLRGVGTGTLYDNYVGLSNAQLNRDYGDANPDLPSHLTVAGRGTANVTLAWGSAVNVGANVGTYNYSSPGVVDIATSSPGGVYVDMESGSLTVAPRTITVSAHDVARIYGNTNPALGWTLSGMGLVNGDTLTGSLATAAGQTANVGTYNITQGTLAASSNYALTFNAGTLSVTPRTITVRAHDLARIYGETNPALGWSVGGMGLVNGDTLTGFLATAGETANAGTHAITQGTLAASPNYEVAFNAGTLSVTPRTITVSADDLARIYGETNPALSWTLSGMGLVNGDTLTGSLATAGQTANAGTHAITQGTLAASSNYALTFNTGTLSVTPRTITVSADDLSRIYGETNPALSWTVGGMGLVNGDTLTGSLATASQTANVGTYNIMRGTLGASPNYALTFNAGTLSVTPRTITVRADDLRKRLEQPDPALIWTIAGGSLAGFDTTGSVFSGDLTRDPGEAVGSYAIRQGTLVANTNYTLAFTNGMLSIDPDAIPVAIQQAGPVERSLPFALNLEAVRTDSDEPPAQCGAGVVNETACAAFIHPANRGLDHVRFAQ